MSRVQELHVGNLLTVVGTIPGAAESFVLPGRDLLPTTLGIGAASVPGSIYANGNVLIGNPTAFPLQEAALMVARPNPLVNPMGAKCISLLKVTNKGMPPSPPTPLDIMLGDPGVGMVGITINSMTINILESTAINIATPLLNITGVKNHAGANNKVGAENQTGASNETGGKTRAGWSGLFGWKKTAGPAKTGPLGAPVASIPVVNGFCTGNKKFDISHPEMSGKRVRHICAEGPEPGIYIRGRLKDSKRIELPDYWEGLVDYDTITVTLTAVGKPQHLYVKSIDKNEIIIDNRKGDECLPSCHYEVWVARWLNPRDHDEKLHVVYEGLTGDDYPGDDCFDI
jgi:hypothetical protein